MQQHRSHSSSIHAQEAAAALPAAGSNWLRGSCAAMAQQVAASGQLELEPLILPPLPVGLGTALGHHAADDATALQQMMASQGLHQGMAIAGTAEGPLAPVLTLLGNHDALSDPAALMTAGAAAATSAERHGGRGAQSGTATVGHQGLLSPISKQLLSPISKQLLTPVSRHLAEHHHEGDEEEDDDAAEQVMGYVALLEGMGSPSNRWHLRSSSRRNTAQSATVPTKTTASRARASAQRGKGASDDDSGDEGGIMQQQQQQQQQGYQLRHRRIPQSSQSKPINTRRTRRQLLQDQPEPEQQEQHEDEQEADERAAEEQQQQQSQQRDRSRSRPSSRSSSRRGERLGVEATVVQQAVASAAFQAAAAGRRPHVPTPFAVEDPLPAEGRRRHRQPPRQQQQKSEPEQYSDEEEEQEGLEKQGQQLQPRVLRTDSVNGSDADQVSRERRTKPSSLKLEEEGLQNTQMQQQRQGHELTPQFYSSSSGWRDGKGVPMGSMFLQAGRPLQLRRETPGEQ